MKVTPVSSPSAVQQTFSDGSATKARAVAAFDQASAPAPVAAAAPPIPVNPNAVSVEELSAVQAPVSQNETEVQEVTAEGDVAAPQRDPEMERRFTQLAKQEKILRAKAQQQENEFKRRIAALEQREAAAFTPPTPPPQTTRQWTRDEAKADPIGYLQDAGLSYDELTGAVMAQQPANPRMEAYVARLEAKISKLEQSTQAQEEAYRQQQTTAYQAAVRQIETDTKNLVTSDPVAYEAISKTGTIKQVVKLIEDTYNKDGYLMSVEEAAQEVENYLVEENYAMANKIEKIRKKLGQASNTPAQANKQTQGNQQQTAMKTLTNATSSTRRLSAKERAVLAFKGELKG